jgi:hypothetical protein
MRSNPFQGWVRISRVVIVLGAVNGGAAQIDVASLRRKAQTPNLIG